MYQTAFDRLFIVGFGICLIFCYFFTITIAFAREKGVSSKEFLISGTADKSVLLESFQHLFITAIGDGPSDGVSEAELKVMAMPDNVILSADISLKKGESKSWAVPSSKSPYNVN
jgi:hypothetical protein